VHRLEGVAVHPEVVRTVTGAGTLAGVGTTVAVRDGLFSVTEPPQLLGSACDACGRLHFPRAEDCPYCGGTGARPVELPRTGRLWSWTAVTAAPPGYRGEVPYGFGVVELDGGLRVIGRLTEAEPSRLRAGQAMHLVVVPLHTDDEGRSVLTYAFAPGEAG